MAIDWLPILAALNAATFVIAVILFILIFVKEALRLVLYLWLRSFREVPILLWRDIGLMGAFCLIFGAGLTARTIGVDPNWLRSQAWWIIPQDLIGLLAIGFWAYVEYFRVGNPLSLLRPPSKPTNSGGQ